MSRSLTGDALALVLEGENLVKDVVRDRSERETDGDRKDIVQNQEV